MNNDLLSGKNTTSHIVSIGITNTEAIIFREVDGEIKQETLKLKHWILCNEKMDSRSILLEGNLHYKYAKTFDKVSDFLAFKFSRKDLDLFEIYNTKERIMVKEGVCFHKGMKHTDISVLSFDIETTTIEHNDKAKLLLISNTYRKQGKLERKLFAYSDYSDEGEMLLDWCSWVRKVNPSIILGHNINMFDFSYIRFIANKYDIDLKLGRDGSKIKFDKKESKFRKDGSQFYHYKKVEIFGREIVDTLFLAIKYDIGRKYENYRLKNIIKQEGLEAIDRVFYDANLIRFNYQDPNEWEKIKSYATFDADDSLSLYDLMVPALFYSAQMIPKPFQLITESAEGGKINSIMLRSYLQQKHSVPKADIKVPFEGAISYGSPGIYKNCWKLDVASLYPSIMIEHKIYDPEKDPKGYFLELVKTLTEERLKNKALAKQTGDSYYKHLEQSQKITINSCYGFLAAQGLSFNSPKLAAEITKIGREILKQAIKWSTGKEYE
jgi:DNA polymerase I